MDSMVLSHESFDLSGTIGDPFPLSSNENNYTVRPMKWGYLDPGIPYVGDPDAGELTIAAGGLYFRSGTRYNFGVAIYIDGFDGLGGSPLRVTQVGARVTYLGGELWLDTTGPSAFFNEYEIEPPGFSVNGSAFPPYINPGPGVGTEVEITFETRSAILTVTTGSRVIQYDGIGFVDHELTTPYLALLAQTPYGNPRHGAIPQCEILIEDMWVTVADLDGSQTSTRHSFE